MNRDSFLHGLNWYSQAEIRSKSYFGGGYRLQVKPATAQASWAFVFAGQGAAHPGMFRDQFHRPEIRSLFERADKLAVAMGLKPLSSHILAPEGADPAPLLPIQNLSLFTLEVAQFDSLLCRGIFPKALTSHSFGEYAMLVAAGVVSFEDMFQLVAYREQISPPPNERGYLVAVGADRDRTAMMLQGKNIYLSNFNSPSQTVIAVAPGDVDEVERVVKEKGAKAKRLPTPQPYHSPLLLSLKPIMRKFLKGRQWNFQPPAIPFVSSVLHREVNAGNFKAEDIYFILENQLVEPVDFIRQVSALGESGSDRLLEIGPTSLLSSLAKDCGARETLWVGDILRKTPRKKAAAKSQKPAGKVLSIVNEVIGKITGYKIEEISLEDRFQEDLGIDSIKKTEIMFTVMDRLNFRPEGEVNYARFTKVEDLVGYMETSAPAAGAAAEAPPKVARFERRQIGWVPKPLDPVWEVSIEPTPLMIPITPEDFGPGFSTVGLAAEFRKQLEECRTKTVIFVASDFVSDLSLTADGSLVDWLERSLPQAVELVQEVIQLEPKLKEVTVGLVTMGQGSVITESMTAFFKSLRKEMPELRFKHIRLDDSDPRIEALRWIRDEMRDPLEWEVRYLHGVRYVPRFDPIPVMDPLPTLPPNATVVAVGGAKGITQSLLLGLEGVKSLYICGRSSETEITPQLDALRVKFPDLVYHAVDATNADEVGPYLEDILERHGHIDLLLHAAGTEVSRALSTKDGTEIRSELWSKALSAAHVVRAVAANPPHRIVFFSSVVSWYGNPGQTIYAGANAILDRLCVELNAAWGAGTAASVLFPPWDGVGMTANKAIRQGLVQRGLSLLSAERANELFKHELAFTEGRVFYFDETDAVSYGAALQTGFPELLGQVVAGRGAFRYERALNANKDRMLTDHRIEGLAYLPAAAGVAMSLASLYLHRKKWVPLSEFVAQSPIVVGDKGAVLGIEGREKNGVIAVTVSTDLGVFQATESTETMPSLPAYKAPRNAEIVPAAHIYSHGGLFHGPAFQTLPGMYAEHTGDAVARLNTADLVELFPGSLWGRLIQWIDTAFQMTAVLEIRRTGNYCLPVRVEGVFPNFTGRPSEKVSLRVERFQSDGSTIRSEVGLFDESGRCFLWLRGVEMKVARGTSAEQRPSSAG